MTCGNPVIAQAGLVRLVKRIFEGDTMAIAVTVGITVAIILGIVVWKLMSRKKDDQE